MMFWIVVWVVAIAVGVVCTRVAKWHSQESDYWFAVHTEVMLFPERDAHHRPVLEWTRVNKPSVWRRAIGWVGPEERMRGTAHV